MSVGFELFKAEFTHLGSISSTYLRTAFTPVAPKSVRIQSNPQYLFTLLGSMCAKAVRRMLVKLTPGFRMRLPHRTALHCIF